VAELEVIEHVDAGLPLIDTRVAHFYQQGTVPSAHNKRGAIHTARRA